jgi:hypothetical protein
MGNHQRCEGIRACEIVDDYGPKRTHPMFGCYHRHEARFSTSWAQSSCPRPAALGLRWWDISVANLKSKNAYLYVDPPSSPWSCDLLPDRLRQCVLSFTDANQTRLGEASFIDCRTSRSPQAAPA